MFTKKTKQVDPGIAEYRKNLPNALGLKQIKADMDAADAAVENTRRKAEDPIGTHNAAHRAAMKTAGIKGHAANRGISKPINQNSRFDKGR